MVRRDLSAPCVDEWSIFEGLHDPSDVSAIYTEGIL